jgi:hypothetical protein
MTYIKAFAAASVAALATVGIVSTAEIAGAFVITGGGYEAANTRSRFVDISTSPSATKALAGSNDATANTTIDFNFKFFNTTYTPGSTVNISSNGLLSFVGANSSGSNLPLTSSFGANNFPTIAAIWQDWNFPSGDSNAAVYYRLAGSVGNRRLVVQWNRAIAGGGVASFQAILREIDNSIEFLYSPGAYSSGTVGIRDINGDTNGQRLQWSYNTPFSSYETVRFRSLDQ